MRTVLEFCIEKLERSIVTGMGYFWNFLVKYFHTKLTQIFVNFLGYFEKYFFFQLKMLLPIITQIFGINLATFILTFGHTEIEFTFDNLSHRFT